MLTIFKFIAKFISLEEIAIILLKAAVAYLKTLLQTKSLTWQAKMFTQWAHVGAITWGAKFANQTPARIDNEVVEQLIDLATSLSITHKFPLHTINPI